MQKLLFFLVCALLAQCEGTLFRNLYKGTDDVLEPIKGADVGEPLILTPFLLNGSFAEAQQAALVQNAQFLNVISYSGLFTVDARFDSNMWFWFFPSAGNVTEDPVMIWLNGGPGATSMNGLFDENGPFIANEDGSLTLREYSWHKHHSVIYFDNPVGVGFSFTNGGLAENQTKIGEDMYSSLTQFFQLFPDLQKNPFYLSGESYAGKYLPAIGHTILKNNPEAKLKINLQGLLIGNGLSDPVVQLNFGTYLYNNGLVSAAVRKQLDNSRDYIVKRVKEGEWLMAALEFNNTINLIESTTQVNIYNYIEKYGDGSIWTRFLNSHEIRKSLHVGNTPFQDKGVKRALDYDIAQGVAPWVEKLLDNYKILIYVGQLDIMVAYPMVVDFLETLNFTGAEDYHNSSRDIWYVDGEPAGYVKSGGNLIELMVRNAGHMVPRDQPKWGYDMVYRFTRNLPYV